MFQIAAVGLVFAAIYSDYPAFTKHGGSIEAYTDQGPIVEMIVRCKRGTGIISYSKIDHKYCSSKWRCSASREAAIANTCG